MLGNTEKQKKLDEMIKLANLPEKKVEKLDYKTKQKYYRAKNKLGTIIHTSRDKNGKGITYVKPKEKK